MRGLRRACPNASAALFTGAKITHLASLPQVIARMNREFLRAVFRGDREPLPPAAPRQAPVR